MQACCKTCFDGFLSMGIEKHRFGFDLNHFAYNLKLLCCQTRKKEMKLVAERKHSFVFDFNTSKKKLYLQTR